MKTPGTTLEKPNLNLLKIPVTVELRSIARQGKRAPPVKTLRQVLSGLILVHRGELIREAFFIFPS